MVNDSSLPGGANQSAFDLDSQAGVTHLLASVRASELSAEQKNELRDLIFLYANGGKDQSVRNTLEQKIQAYKLVPVAPIAKPAATEEAAPAEPVYPFGTSRPSPSFSASAQAAEEGQPPSAPPVAPKSQPRPEPVAAPAAPEVPTPPPARAAAPASGSEPVQKPTPTPAPAPTPAAPPVPEAQAEPVPSQVPGYDPTQSLQRIREIKSLVNDKVGNPVNLVDINNEVGREYMGALLDAMKKLNNGTSALSAMKRLEEAYQVVEKTLAEHAKSEGAASTAPSEPVPIVSPNPPVEAPVAPKEKVATPVKPAEPQPVTPPTLPQPKPAEPQPAAALTPTPVPAPVSAPTPPHPKPVVPHEEPKEIIAPEKRGAQIPAHPAPEAPAPVEKKVVEIKSAPANLPTQTASAPAPKDLPVQQPKTETPPPIINTKPPAPTPAAPTAAKETPSNWGAGGVEVKKAEKPTLQAEQKMSSLAQAKVKPHTPEDLPKASALETSSVSGDPLFTKEVDDGLQQLLSEWSLFKKSGLFGTGPKGREHPLFLKVAGLQIPLLLAGRFEGATQEVKQSITDYMNGWRYEQGIIYEQGETFEHYLRRVIRHILDLQKRKIVR